MDDKLMSVDELARYLAAASKPAPKKKPEPLMSVDDVAEYLGIPKASIYAWNSRGWDPGPPRYKVGKYVRYKRSEVDAWLETRATKETPAWIRPTRRRA